MKKKEKEKFLLEEKRKKFIELMIGASDSDAIIKAYQAVFPQCTARESARVGAYRLLQDITIKTAIDEGKREAEEERKQAERKERIRLAAEKVAHETELDAEMSDIALGRKTRLKKVVLARKNVKEGDDEYEIVEVEETPTAIEQIAASDKLYKRKGSYAVNKIEHSFDNTFMDFLKQSSANTDGQAGNL